MKNRFFILLIPIFVCFLATGCLAQDSPLLIPKTVIPKPLTDGGRTSQFTQWVEVRGIFSQDESPAIIFHCEGKIGVVGEWKTETICWPDISEHSVKYISVPISTHTSLASGSGFDVVDIGYWGVDIHNNGIDDLVLIEWKSGEYKKDGQVRGSYQTVIYDYPSTLRLISRRSKRNSLGVVEQDRTINWGEVKSEFQTYERIIKACLKSNTDAVWEERLIKALR